MNKKIEKAMDELVNLGALLESVTGPEEEREYNARIERTKNIIRKALSK